MANQGVTFEFAAESAKLRNEIDKVRKQVGALNGTVKGIEKGFKTLGGVVAGAFSVSAIGAFLGRINAAADGLNDLSGRLGASASGLQSIQLAAQLAGGSAEAANNALAKMSTTLGEAMAGNNKRAAEAFGRLGLSLDELSKLKADEAFGRINQRLSEIPNTYERATVAQDIFGRGAKDLAGLFAEGGSAIDEVNRKLAEQGALISDLDVAKIGVMNDELAFQGTVVTNLGTKFLSGLTPAVGVATGAVGEMLGRLGGASEAGKLFGTVMVGAIKIVETAAYGLAATFETVRAVISGMLAIIADGIGSVLGGVASTAEFFGLQIAGPIRNAANLMDGIGASLQNVSDQARENATQAASYAIEAATNIVKAGEIFNAAQADYERKAAEAAARNAAAQGAGSGYIAPGGKDKKVPDYSLGTLRTDTKIQDALAKDPTTDPKYLYQQSLGAALEQLATDQAAAQLNIAQVGNASILDSLLLNHDYMIAAEEAKNQTLGASLTSMVGLAIQQGGKLGKFAKAFAIAQTVWSGGTAIIETFKNNGGYPFGIAPAAAMAATVAAKLASIKSTNIGSGGSAGGVSGGSSAGSSALRDIPTTSGEGGQALEQQKTVQVVVQGDLFNTGRETAEKLAELLGDLINNADAVFISPASRQAAELRT